MAEVVDTFVLTSVTDRTTRDQNSLWLRGPIPRDDYPHGADTADIIAEIANSHVSASVSVHDAIPAQWSLYFADLAKHWRGWIGEKRHQSFDRRLTISCTSQRTGHVKLRIVLRNPDTDNWQAEVTLDIEAGQLDAIAKAAARYFEP